jgi:O-antigen ligase
VSSVNNLHNGPENNSIISILFLCCVGLIPWLHGAELDWEILLFTVLFMLLLSGTLFSNKVNITNEFTSVKLPLILLLCWFVYCGLFLIPLPKEWIEILSPNILLVQENGNSSSSEKLLTLSKALTLIELAKVVCVICVFCLCYQIAKVKKQQNNILKVLFYSSAVMALYSQLNHYTDGQYELIEAIPPWDANWKTTVRGTFSYKNQYAIYLAMTMALGTGLLFDEINAKYQDLALNSFTSIFRNIILEKHFLDIVLSLVMLVSFFGADSRGASLVLIVTTVLISFNYILRSKKSLWSKKHLFVTLGIALIFTVIFVPSKSFERYEKYGLKDHGRGALHLTAISVVKEYPILGTGPGTYPAIQHQYKTVELGNSAMSKHAHSDYLEFFAAQGVLGCLLLGTALLLMLFKAFSFVPVKNVGKVLGCQIAVLSLLVHSAIDFNFGTLALSVYFFVILAVLLRMAEPPKLNG